MTPYSTISKLLHWGLAVIILSMLAFGNALTNAEPTLETIQRFNQHKVAGLVALALILWRVIERLRSGASFPGGTNPAWDDYLARIVHIAFYVAMIAMPLTGWVGSSAAGIDPVIFGVILPGIVPQNPDLSDTLFVAHGVIGKILLGLFALHMIGLFKRLIGGDQKVIERMTG
ncbi:MAG: cytochrome b/b6 domain-containing protein [Pseudomonadota bacterium]